MQIDRLAKKTGGLGGAADVRGRGGWSQARVVSEIVSGLFLTGILVVVFASARSLKVFASAPAPVMQNNAVGAVPAPPATEQKTTADAVRKMVDEEEARHQLILDRLVTLVGGYALFVGFVAFFSLKAAKEEAERQIASAKAESERQIASAKADAAGQNEQIKKDWETFSSRIWDELPDMRSQQENITSLLRKLEQLLPLEKTWSSEDSFDKLTDGQEQQLEIMEIAIGGLRSLISDRSTANLASLTRLYRGIAKLYMARSKNKKRLADSFRAEAYLLLAREIEPKDVATHRTLGVIYIGRQELTDGIGAASAVGRGLLQDAKTHLEAAIKLDANNLGSYYNLALAKSKLGDVDASAIQIRDILKRIESYPTDQLHKYLGSVVLNQACDLNALARSAGDETRRGLLRNESLKVLEEGMEWLHRNNSPGVESFRKDLDREFDGKDLAEFRWKDRDKQTIELRAGEPLAAVGSSGT